MEFKKKLLFILVLIWWILPILNYYTFGASDPFNVYSISIAQALHETGNLDKAYVFIMSAYIEHGVHTWSWQMSTANMIKTQVIGSPILLHTIYEISGIALDTIGNSPIPYIAYFFIFITIIIWIVKHSKDEHNVLITFLIITAVVGFVKERVIPNLLAFQFHAVGLVSYLSLILLFLKLIERVNSKKILILTFLFYISLLYIHYRFPIIIFINFMLFSIGFLISSKISLSANSYFLRLSKELAKISILFFILLTVQPFYWWYAGASGFFVSKISTFIEYIKTLLGVEHKMFLALKTATQLFWYSQYWKIFQYGEVTAFLIFGLVAMYILAKKLTKSPEPIPPWVFLFLWGYGATIFYTIYAIAYQGIVGISLYEEFMTILFSIPLLTYFSNFSHKAKKILRTSLIALSITMLVNISFSWYTLYTFKTFPNQAKVEATEAYQFLLTSSDSYTRVVGGSFIVSAGLYEYMVMQNISKIQFILPKRIVNEVILYKNTAKSSVLTDRIRQDNDMLLLTEYEINKGLSSDVFLSAFLTENEVKNLNKYFMIHDNVIFSSTHSKLFLFILN